MGCRIDLPGLFAARTGWGTAERLCSRRAACDRAACDRAACDRAACEPVTEQPVTEQPVTEQPVTEQPVTEQPVTEQPVTEQPVTEQPVTEQPVTEQPVMAITESDATSNLPPAGAEAPAPGVVGLLTWTGWIAAALLAVVLLLLVKRWRTAFETKEWLLLPSFHAAALSEQLESLKHGTLQLRERMANGLAGHSSQLGSLESAVRDTRAEFAILREELDRKASEINHLRLGHEFRNRRSVLRVVAHALQIIEEDAAKSVEPQATLEGLRVELMECLENHAVTRLVYEPGTRLVDARGISVQESQREPAPSEDLRGTIGETLRPAFVAIGPGGDEEILAHSRVRFFA